MNLRRLYERLDADARRVLQGTADVAAREGRRSITIDMFLLSLLRDRGVGAAVMQGLGRAGANGPAIETALARRTAAEARGKAGALPAFDESLAQLLRETWSLTFDEYGESQVVPLRFFETVARRGDLWPKLVAALPGFGDVDLAALAMAARGGGAMADVDEPGAAPAATDAGYPELSRYGHDMVASAREDGFDPVVGFAPQFQAIAATLLRRRQNSVVVVGESGVGKTACALGFVSALARKLDAVPTVLHDTPVWSLSLSALRAGAMVRGALEERLQAIVKEVADDGMILYIDDLHLLFGEQGGGADALRNVLSDGSLRILGTCGWREWRRHVEPDPGLARRIASVRVQEPDDAGALEVVSCIAPVLASHHGVKYGEDAFGSAVRLSRRYIVGRQLPDKAIAVLDSACARARMRGAATVTGDASDAEVNAAAEVDAATEVNAGAEVAAAAEADAAAEVDGTESDAGTQSAAVVTDDDVAAIVSDLTGVPIGSMLSDVGRTAARLESVLGERVVGQDDALARCASQARAYLAGLSDRRQPVGALIFCGPSGVGKTETAHALADALFGGRLLTINMSEYQEAHTVSGLKGAPAGYVGYGEGGVLTEGIRRTPYSVVLLDEIEKAHGDVIEMLYQVLDRGWMEDAEGIEADFSNALIVLTTNAGDTVMEKAFAADPPPDEEALQQTLSRALHEHFPAAFIGRLQLVPYWPLGEATLGQIAGMRLARLARTYRESHRADLVFDETVRNWLVDQVLATPQGARFLDGVVAKSIRPAVADYVLDRLGNGLPPGDATVVRQDGQFVAQAAQ